MSTPGVQRPEALWPDTCHGRWMSPEYEPGLVSVIIPTYNRAHFLVEAMDSVWNQTYRPIELIVVDDGSTDNTSDVVQDWVRKCEADDQFHLRTFHQENKGAPAARNLGLIESHGEYIQFLDSDDYLHPGRFHRLVALSVNMSDFELATTGYAVVDEAKQITRLIRSPDVTGENRVEECIRQSLWTTAPLYARGFVRTIAPWREDLEYWQDWEYGIRVALRITRGGTLVVDEVLCYARDHPNNRISYRAKGSPHNVVSAAAEAISQSGLPQRQWYDLLALRLVHAFTHPEGGGQENLRHALHLPCSAWLRFRIGVLLAVSALLGASVVRRYWRRVRDRWGRRGSC